MCLKYSIIRLKWTINYNLHKLAYMSISQVNIASLFSASYIYGNILSPSIFIIYNIYYIIFRWSSSHKYDLNVLYINSSLLCLSTPPCVGQLLTMWANSSLYGPTPSTYVGQLLLPIWANSSLCGPTSPPCVGQLLLVWTNFSLCGPTHPCVGQFLLPCGPTRLHSVGQLLLLVWVNSSSLCGPTPPCVGQLLPV